MSDSIDRERHGPRDRFYGVYPAIVTDIVDPERQGRVQVRPPRMPDDDRKAEEVWARLATLMAGNDRGTWFVPDVGDEVLVSFEAGDANRPYVIGALWNDRDAPPEEIDDRGDNDVKRIVTRSGVQIVMNDASGQESLTLQTPGGQTLELTETGITIADHSGNTVEMEAAGITITSPGKVTVTASTVEVTSAMVTVDAGLSKFSGIVQADAVITNTVISSVYTPGTGNVM